MANVFDEEAPRDVSTEGSPWVRELYLFFEPVREWIAANGFSEDEINADIDAAIKSVRAEQSQSSGLPST